MKRNSGLFKFVLATIAIAIAIGLSANFSPARDFTASNSLSLDRLENSSLIYNPVDFSPNLYAAAGCPTIDCTNLAFRHIRDRHCNASCPTDNKSIFVANYCGSAANMRKFCNAIKNSSNCQQIAQRNGRIKAVATLSSNVGTNRNNGCNSTNIGSVIYDPSGNIVVTQFPGK
jgi:hypothetical protein